VSRETQAEPVLEASGMRDSFSDPEILAPSRVDRGRVAARCFSSRSEIFGGSLLRSSGSAPVDGYRIIAAVIERSAFIAPPDTRTRTTVRAKITFSS